MALRWACGSDSVFAFSGVHFFTGDAAEVSAWCVKSLAGRISEMVATVIRI